MTIYSLMRGAGFDRDTINAVATAFDAVCRELDLSTRSDPVTEVVGQKIIALAQQGTHDPEKLTVAALAYLESMGVHRAG
jgi:hypothetical protein